MDRRRIFLVPTRADVPVATAIEHWTTAHGPIFGGTPELGGYVQHRPSDADQQRLGGRVCAEAWFADREAEARAFASEHYRTVVTADEERFVDRARAWTALVRAESRVGARQDARDGAVEVVAFGVDGDALPEGTSARVLTLDRPGPEGCAPSMVIASAGDEASGRALADALGAAVAFVARRGPTLPA